MIWVHHSDPRYAVLTAFIAQKIWGNPRPMSDGTLAVSVTQRGMAVVLFHNWDAAAGVIEITAASDDPRWLSRPVLWELFNYPFATLGCQAVVARIDPERDRLARIFTAYGFKRYDLPRLRGRNKGEAVLILGDDDWRANGFHKEHAHGQISASADPC